MERTSLELHGVNNVPIPNTFVSQSSNHLCVIFPGLGYTADMPLLYYSSFVMESKGADVLQVNYDYKTKAFQSLSQEDQYNRIISDATAAYKVGRKQSEYKNITLIGKSLGTLALGHLLMTQPELHTANFIWLTPLFRNEAFRLQVMSLAHHALFVIGSSDPYYDKQILSGVETSTGGESLVFEDADHSLEIPGKPLESLQVLQRYLSRLEAFVKDK
jgi:hypothetical protein